MDIKPTRSELIKLKKRIKLAQGGYKLLKKKRDGLILEFFEILKETKSVRREMTQKYKEAIRKINTARIADGDLAIKSASMAIKDKPIIDVDNRNIMGVVVPKIEAQNIKKSISTRGFGLNTSSALNEAAQAYEELLEYIILVAEVETAMMRLLEEIDKTKRRVNALEFEVIPKMQRIKSFIELRLEEQERESIFRSKRIKKKRE